MYSILSLGPSRIGLGHAAVVAAASFFIGAASIPAQTLAPGTGSTAAVEEREVITEAELRRKMQAGKTLEDFKGTYEAAPEVKPDLTPSLYKKSIILFDGQAHTVVPIGAVLRLPQNYRSRIIDKPKGDFLFWPAFVEKNKSWVGGWEVSMAMARGDAEQAKSVMNQTAQDTRVLVAVYKGGPITILEAVPDKTSKTSGAKE